MNEYSLAKVQYSKLSTNHFSIDWHHTRCFRCKYTNKVSKMLEILANKC